MKRFFLILGSLLVLAVFSIWFIYFRGGKKRDRGERPVPIAVGAKSDSFNQATAQMMDAYYGLSESFVNWDTAGVGKFAQQLKTNLESFPINDLKNDSIIYQSAAEPLQNSVAEINTLINAPALADKKIAYKNLSENLRILLIAVHYDRQKIYWQECPMALGEDVPANWLSKTEDVRNPYLGTSHPEYKASMLNCGESKGLVVDTSKSR